MTTRTSRPAIAAGHRVAPGRAGRRRSRSARAARRRAVHRAGRPIAARRPAVGDRLRTGAARGSGPADPRRRRATRPWLAPCRASRPGDRPAGRGATPEPMGGSAADERQRALLEGPLPWSPSVPASGYSPEKQASQWRPRVAADGLVDARQRQVGQRVGAQLGGDLVHGAPVGDHLLARGHVDAVVAGVLDRRGGDAHVHLGRARRRAASARSGGSCCRARSSRRRRPAACPPTISGSGLNFSRRPCLRSSWPGWMNVRAT